jgi:hypothetical protein
MYVVRDIATSAVIFINPAPLAQNLTGEEVYYLYDPDTMEIGRTDSTVLPEYFTIDSQQNIRELTLEELVQAGIIQLTADQKIVDNQIVEKTISEKIAEGSVILTPSQKVVGSGNEEKIVKKTPSEMIAENLLELSPTQIITGEGEDEKIITKSLEQLLEEGLIKLTPNQRIGNGQIVTYSDDRMLEQGLIDLDEYKQRRITELSDLAFTLREELIPEYKLLNASMDIYGETEKAVFLSTVQAFRDEFYRLKSLIKQAPDLDAVKAVKEDYPRKLVKTDA